MAALEAPSDDSASFAYPPQPPLKRARLADPATAIVAVQPIREQLRAPVYPEAARGISVMNSERLRSVLCGNNGVFQFLVLDDAVSILNSCRLLRTDTTLVAACARALPEFARLVASTDATTTFPTISSTTSTSTTTPVFRLRGEWVQDLVAVSAPSELPAQVVTTAAFLQKRVQHWCFDGKSSQPPNDVIEPGNEKQETDQDDSLCSVQPVLIPLAQLTLTPTTSSTSSSSSSSSPPKWSRAGIKTALNSLCAGGGDAFFDDKTAAESRFATHWDSIYIDRVSGRVSCRLCDAVRDSLALYRRQVALGERQYTLMLRHKQAQWAQQAVDIEQLTTEFREKYFPADAYIRPECGEWSESRLLRHICAHGNFQAWQIGDTRARGIASTDALVRAVSATCQHQCRTFYQPLKKTLQRKCQVLGRIPHATLQTTRLQVPELATTNDKRVVLTELVGGVECSSGIFSGVQLTFRLTP